MTLQSLSKALQDNQLLEDTSEASGEEDKSEMVQLNMIMRGSLKGNGSIIGEID